MLLIRESEIGRAAYLRALRTGALVPLTRTVAIPRDIPVSSALRALALAPDLPSHAVVTALAGLWLHGGGPVPPTIDTMRRHGTHRVDTPTGALGPVVVHSYGGRMEGTVRWGSVSVAAPSRCVVDALRWSPLSDAVPPIWAALRSGLVAAGEIERDLPGAPTDPTRRRAAAAWTMIADAFTTSRRGAAAESRAAA